MVDHRNGKDLAAIPSPSSSAGSSSSSTPSHDYAGGGANGLSSAAACRRSLSGTFSPKLRGQHPRLRLRLGSSSTAGRRMLVPRDATGSFDYELEFHHILKEGEEEQVESSYAKDALPRKEKVAASYEPKLHSQIRIFESFSEIVTYLAEYIQGTVK